MPPNEDPTMSVGSESPFVKTVLQPYHRVERRPPGGSRSPGRSTDWSRTSFKISKPKPSKTRYLSRSELLGIGLSALLSLAFTLLIFGTLYLATPIVFQQASNFLEDMAYLSRLARGAASGAQRNPSPSPLGEPLPLTPAQFAQRHLLVDPEQQAPALFTMADAEELRLAEGVLGRGVGILRVGPRPSAHGLRIPLAELLAEHLDLDQSAFAEGYYYYAREDAFATTEEVFAAAGANPSQQQCTSDPDPDPDPMHMSRLLPRYLPQPSPSAQLTVLRAQQHLLGGGGGFHAGRPSLTLMVQGSRQCALFPPHRPPAASPLWTLPHYLGRAAASAASSSTPEEVLQLVEQRAGQWLYVPEGWTIACSALPLPHPLSTPSSTPSVALTWTSDRAPPRTSSLHYLEEGDVRMARGDAEAAGRLYKLGLGLGPAHQLPLLLRLAQAHEQTLRYAEAEEVYREALRRNPNQAQAAAALLRLLLEHSHSHRDSVKGEDEGVAQLLREAQAQGIRGEVLLLLDEQMA